MKWIIAALLFLPALIIAQELDATVSINTDRLSAQYKDKLVSFAQEIRDYINNNKYTGNQWQYARIKCSFNIYFQSADDETKYTAQVYVNSIRPIDKTTNASPMLNVMDNTWSFEYERGQSMRFNQTNFDPLTSLFDFYAYIILGMDFDSYDMLGGTKYFNNAVDLAMIGSSSKYSTGWDKGPTYSRRGLAEDFVNEKYRKFREDFWDYHYNGLDLMTVDKAKAQDNMAKLVRDLEVYRNKLDLRGILLKVFFDAKSGEIINYLSDYGDKATVMAELKRIDPAHISKYEEAMND